MDLRALLLRSAGVALAYAAVGALALQVSVPPVHAGPIYPSASIALAANLFRLANELVKSPEFEALLREERFEMEGTKILEAAEAQAA